MTPATFIPSPDRLRLRARANLVAVILLAALSLPGCAKIADPEPPQVRIPKPAIDLAARQLSDFLVLTVSKPAVNTNGSEATTLQRVDVYRLGEDVTAADRVLDDEQFIKSATRILSIPTDLFPQHLNENVFVFEDRFSNEKSAMYSLRFQYAVLFVNNKNQSAGLSNRVTITPVPIPRAPADIKIQGTQDAIRLKWTAPAENMDGSKPPRNAGYNIYRTEVPDTHARTPINSSPVTGTEFEDISFRFDTTYYYSITTVGNLQQPYPESLPSSTASLTTKDLFPPMPPGDFSAIMQADAVILLWSPSPSADLAGYRLYRREKSATGRQLLQPDLIRTLSFRDSKVEPDKAYDYEIEAVDTHGNQSETARAASE